MYSHDDKTSEVNIMEDSTVKEKKKIGKRECIYKCMDI